ncbi:MAG: right-handed parallel beta-helix repeat-containing protein [Acidimicrobiales bacterium]
MGERRTRARWWAAGAAISALVAAAAAPSAIGRAERDRPPTVTAACGAAPAGARVIQPSDTPRVLVAEAGETLFFCRGVHRVSVEAKANARLLGDEGAVLSGADVLKGWTVHRPGTRRAPAVWKHTLAKISDELHGECADGAAGCTFPQDLFAEPTAASGTAAAKPLRLVQAASLPASLAERTWWIDRATLTIYLALSADPNTITVELGARNYGVANVDEHSVNVTVRGADPAGCLAGRTSGCLRIERYAVPAQRGALQTYEPGRGDPPGAITPPGWIVDGVLAQLNHGVGVKVGGGSTVRNSRMVNNGQLGLSVYSDWEGDPAARAVVERNVISWNNYAGYSSGWEAGGAKFARTKDLVVRANIAAGNAGKGLWTDIDNRGTVYEANTVTDNADEGILHEISHSALIRNNVVLRNGFARFRTEGWFWGAGISIQSSDAADVNGYTRVSGNTVNGNANGIVGIGQDSRGVLRNLWVDRNTVTGAALVGVAVDNPDAPSAAKRCIFFTGNTYKRVGEFRFEHEPATANPTTDPAVARPPANLAAANCPPRPRG